MNYYIKGDAAKAEQIKAAFEKAGYIVSNWKFNVNGVVYYTTKEKRIDLACSNFLCELIMTHPDYKELELPKPHYDIANFHAGMPVLVRWCDTGRWRYSLYSFYEEDSINPSFDTVKGSFTQCIPYNDDTKHLLGTTDMCDECYINW